MHEYSNSENSLYQLINKLEPVDLIIVEGWKNEKITKIEVYRSLINKPFLYKKDKNIVAIATDKKLNIPGKITLNLNNYNEIAMFIKDLLKNEI